MTPHELKCQINEVLNELRYGFTDYDEAADRLFQYASQFKSQLPIEQKPEEQALVKENAELRKHLLEITEWFDTGCYVDDKAHLMIIKAQKFLNPERWLATRKGSTETRYSGK